MIYKQSKILKNVAKAKEDFFICFRFFAKRIDLQEQNYDIKIIEEYKNCFIIKPPIKINTLAALSQCISGHLVLVIQQSATKKRLEKIEYNREQYYIVSGVFISPYVRSLLTENGDLIPGFLLDTTWKVVTKYVISIQSTKKKIENIDEIIPEEIENIFQIVKIFKILISKFENSKTLFSECYPYLIKSLTSLNTLASSGNPHAEKFKIKLTHTAL